MDALFNCLLNVLNLVKHRVYIMMMNPYNRDVGIVVEKTKSCPRHGILKVLYHSSSQPEHRISIIDMKIAVVKKAWRRIMK